jgi:hypothetical protein
VHDTQNQEKYTNLFFDKYNINKNIRKDNIKFTKSIANSSTISGEKKKI